MAEKKLITAFVAKDNMSSVLSAIAGAAKETKKSISDMEDTAVSSLEAAVEAASATAEKMETALSAEAEGMKNLDEKAQGACASAENLRTAAESVSDETESLRETAKTTSDEVDKLGKSADDTADDLDKLSKSADDTKNKTKDAMEDLAVAITAAGITKAIDEVKNSLLACSDAASIYETSTAKLSTIADTQRASMAELSGEIKQLSNETGVGVNALSESTYQAISASVDTASAAAFTGTATKLATAGFTQSATAVDVLTTSINAYHKKAEDAERIGDMLITTQNLGKTSVDQLAQSVGKVIPIASAYNVEMDNLMTSYAELTKGGIATAESTTYLKGMLNELGDSGNTVAKTLMEETGMSFAQLSSDGKSLGDVLAILGESVNNDTTKFNELWSSQEAGIGALALFNTGAEQYNATLAEMRNSAGATEEAYKKMIDTTAHHKEVAVNAAENLAISIGEQVNPAMNRLYDAEAKVLTGITELVEQHPYITKGIVAVTTGLSAVALGIVGVTVVIPFLKTKILELGAAVMGAMGPVGWGVAAAVALTTLVGTMVLLSDENEKLTASSQKQADEIDRLKEEYYDLLITSDENSKEAVILRAEIDDLTESFNASKQTTAEFYEELNKTCDAHDKLIESFDNTNQEIYNELTVSESLIDKLQELSENSENAAGAQEEMRSIVERLNEMYPNLGLTIDDVNSGLSATAEEITAVAEAQAKLKFYENAEKTYADLMTERSELVKQQQEAEAILAQTAERVSGYGLTEGAFEYIASLFGTTDFEEAEANYNRVSAAIAEIDDRAKQCKNTMQEHADIMSGTSDIIVTKEEAVMYAVAGVSEELVKLCEEYDKAYEAAYNSIDGTVGLFGDMKAEAVGTVFDMKQIWEENARAINSYTDNLQKAKEYGLDEGLIASLSDGSAESAANLQQIISTVESLGITTQNAKNFVSDFNASFDKVEEAKKKWADNVADMQTSFSEGVKNIKNDMDKLVANMEMEEEARKAAQKMLNGYIQEIINAKGAAVRAASEFSAATAAALSASTPAVGVAANAEGGIYDRPLLTWVAEAGDKEAIIPLNDSERAFELWKEAGMQIGNARGMNSDSFSPPNIELPEINSSAFSNFTEKRITLNIAGSGSITIPNMLSKEEVVNLLKDNLSPVLLELIQQEMFDGGDAVYDT